MSNGGTWTTPSTGSSTSCETDLHGTCQRLASSFGWEVAPTSRVRWHGSDVDSLRKLLDEHLLVVIRDQHLSPTEQIALTELLGPCESPWETFAQHPEHPQIHVLSTAKVPPRAYRTSSQHWHCDRSFLPVPTRFTLLHAIRLPGRASDTLWVDTRAAFAGLPPPLSASLSHRRGIHDYGWKFGDLLQRRVGRIAADRERARFPPVSHPLVMTNTATGHRSLYVSELCLAGIEGVDAASAAALIGELMATVLRTAPRYRHRWRQGDLVIWDNAATMHRNARHETSDERLVHRTSVGMGGGS